MRYCLSLLLISILLIGTGTSLSAAPEDKNPEDFISNIHWLGHASFLIQAEGKTIYINPWQLKSEMPKADFILLSNNKFDHLSKEDIESIKTAKTTIIAPKSTAAKVSEGNIKIAAMDKTVSYGKIKFTPIPAYNLDNRYYKKEEGFSGFIISVYGTTIYYAGATDLIPEMKNIKCNIAILPVSGTYTMTPQEAAKAAEIISPKTVIPMYYGKIVGSIRDAETLKEISPIPVTLLETE